MRDILYAIRLGLSCGYSQWLAIRRVNAMLRRKKVLTKNN